MSTRSEIVAGMAEIMWASEWSSHAEEHGCVSLSGRQILDIMPPVPAEAKKLASNLAKAFESKNGVPLTTLYAQALAADEAEGKGGRRHSGPEHFGSDLALQDMGHGVSWFDDHAEFPLKFPRYAEHNTYDLMFIAEKRCKVKTSSKR